MQLNHDGAATRTRQTRSAFNLHTASGTGAYSYTSILSFILFTISIFWIFLHHIAFGNLNITMQSVILEDDGKEPELSPSESDSTCQATEDEDYYLHFVTFEVKG